MAYPPTGSRKALKGLVPVLVPVLVPRQQNGLLATGYMDRSWVGYLELKLRYGVFTRMPV